MARSSQSSTVRIGGIAECGFAFRNKAGTLVPQTAINFEVFVGSVSAETFTQADPRVTLDTTVGADLAEAIDVSDSENTAGIGIVSVELEVDAVGRWAVYADGVTPVADAQTAFFRVIDKADHT